MPGRPREEYTAKQVERAHWWLAKAYDTLAEADSLIPSGQTRAGAYNRLYYTAHHLAVALLRLVGDRAKSHKTIHRQFGLKWVRTRSFPKSYGKLLTSLYSDRDKADYGEFVPTYREDLDKRRRKVWQFAKRASKEIPSISMAHLLEIVVAENPDVRDFSFDVYCPKSYYHHTRLSVWVPKGRVTDKWLNSVLSSSVRTLQNLKIEEATDYVLGLNSRVNQYAEQHLLMLDFDDVSTVPYDELEGEPGFYFRTESGFHFVGSQLYGLSDWKKKMREYAKAASRDHYELSMKRRYATVRITASPRKPVQPAYIGRSRPQ